MASSACERLSDMGNSFAGMRSCSASLTSIMDDMERDELFESVLAEFDAETRGLDAAERNVGPDRAMLVDPGGAAFDLHGEVACAGDVGGPDGAAQPEADIVRLLQCVV